MKKLALFIVAAVVAASVNAEPPYGGSAGEGALGGTVIGSVGWYDLETETWVDAVPAVNQRFTFAIEVTNVTVLSWLALSPNNTVGIQDWRSSKAETVNKRSFRLKNMGENLYAIDMVVKQMFPDIDLSTLTTDEPTTDNGGIIHFAVTKAQAGGPGIENPGSAPAEGFWPDNVYGYHWFGVQKASGADAPAMPGGYEGLELPYGVPGIALPGVSAGFKDVFASSEEPVSVEYYSLQGVRLSAGEGLVIAIPVYEGGVKGAAQKLYIKK